MCSKFARNVIKMNQTGSENLLWFPADNAHTESIFKRLILLKVSDILKMQELKFYLKIIHEKILIYLQNLPLYANTKYL